MNWDTFHWSMWLRDIYHLALYKNFTPFFNQNVPLSLTPQRNFNEISNSIQTQFLLYLLDGYILKQQNICDQLCWAVILLIEDPLVKAAFLRANVVFLKVYVAEQFTLLKTGGK